jgi:hypothetical protein
MGQGGMEVPCVYGDAEKIRRANYEWNSFKMADFFLVQTATLFTLRTFGAQIN